MTGTSGSFLAGSVREKAATNLRSKQKFCFEICELRDIFLRKTGTKYSPRPLAKQYRKTWRTTQDFFVWAENSEPEQNLPK